MSMVPTAEMAAGAARMFPVTEHVVKTPRHTSFYLECGRADAVPIIFVHGWPELSISWRHQLPCFASLGFRAIAPDMRGYGQSTVYPRHEDYALERIVTDMIELLDSLGRDKAIWVGHDWGSPVVWDIANHHPDRCHAVASLCVPYFPPGFSMRGRDRSGGPYDLSRGRPARRTMGLSIILSRELRQRRSHDVGGRTSTPR